MRKKILAIVTAALMLISLMPVMSFAAGSGREAQIFNVSTETEFLNRMNNAVDGDVVRFQNDINLHMPNNARPNYGTFDIPQNCLVTLDLNGHTLYAVDQYGNRRDENGMSFADNFGVGANSALLIKNGSVDYIDTYGDATGIFILTNVTVNRSMYLGGTQAWIVNNSKIVKILYRESGKVNPGADALNPVSGTGGFPGGLTEPYEHDNPAPAMVGSSAQWKCPDTLQGDFNEASNNSSIYNKIIMLKDYSLEGNSTLTAGGINFNLGGFTITTGGKTLSLDHASGTNRVSNGAITGDLSMGSNTGTVELYNLDVTGIVSNGGHPTSISSGHYNNITGGTGKVTITDGFYKGSLTGGNYEISGGRFVNKPNPVYIKSGYAAIKETYTENGTTYNYKIGTHAHTWNYAAGTGTDSNKLYAYCTDSGCAYYGTESALTDALTLTLTAPSNLEYDGNVKEATVDETEKSYWKAATGNEAPDIVYKAKNGTMLTNAQVKNVGTYTANITEGGKTATCEFSITAVPEAPVNPWTLLAGAMADSSKQGLENEFTVSDTGGVRTIKLLNDFTADASSSQLSVGAGMNIILDLNGHVINANGANFSVIMVDSDRTLAIQDSIPSESHDGYVDANGLWHLGTGEGTSKSISGGIITGGISNGGGVNVNGGTFIMSSGTLAGNSSGTGNGGGVYVGSGNVSVLGTAAISGNTGNSGAGVYLNDGSLTVGGAAQITGNVTGDGNAANNLYLPDGKTVVIGTGDNAPSGMNVGVTTVTLPAANSPVAITSNGSESDLSFFTSDNDAYNIVYDSSHLELCILCTVTYTGDYEDTVPVKCGESVTLPVAETGYHYVFTSGGEAWDGTNITADTTVDVTKVINTYTVTYTGDYTGTETVDHGGSVTLPVCQETGYHFVLTAGGNPFDGINITADMTVNVVKTINTYTVTYTGDYTGIDTVNHGDSAILPVAETGYHYVFTSGGAAWDGTNITADTTVDVAKVINTYTVTYTGDYTGTETVDHGGSVTLPVCPETGFHYEFTSGGAAWDGTNITADIMVNVVKSINTYTVTFIANGHGTAPAEKKDVAYNTVITAPAPAPTADGYTFGGWCLDKSCKQPWNFKTDTVTENIVLYAKWIENSKAPVKVNDAIVKGSNGDNEKAKVELYKGTELVVSTQTDENGKYNLGTVPAGVYNLVITNGEKVTTILLIVESRKIPEVTIPDKDVGSKVEFTGEKVKDAKINPHQIVVGGLDEIAKSMNPKPGEFIDVKLLVEPKEDEGTPEQKALKKEAGNGRKVDFLDMSLLMQVNGGELTNIGGGNDKLLTIVIPFDFGNVDVDSLVIIRNHNDNTDRITTKPNKDGEYFKADYKTNTINLYAMKFSEYAVAYLEKPEEEPTEEPTEAPSEEPTTAPDEPPAKDEKTNPPQTGDKDNMLSLLVLLAAAGASATVIYIRRRKQR